MANIQIEDLPSLVAEGKITKHKGADDIWVDIYLHPSIYGIGLFDEDQKSEFLLNMKDRFETLFDTYKSGGTSFKMYIRGCVRNSMFSFLRKEIRSQAAEKSTYPSSELELENKREDYYNEQIKSGYDNEQYKIKELKLKKKRKIAQTTALILLLKSCCIADDVLISKVSEFSGLEKKDVEEKVKHLQIQINDKKLKREKIIKRRDNAFYFHRKYFIEMKNANPQTMYYKRLEVRYKSQTKSWERQNNLLQHRFIMQPSNIQIAKELGIGPRQVGFYISHADKTADSIKNEVD